MADQRLAQILSWLKQEEGGFGNDPDDTGGKTNFGITDATLLRAIEQQLVPATTTPERLTWQQAQLIYKVMYWDLNHCPEIPAPYCWWVFDTEVNQGTVGMVFLQAAVHVEQDGLWGPNTLKACLRADTKQALEAFSVKRLDRYRKHKLADKWFRGWAGRVSSLLIFSMEQQGSWGMGK